MPTVAQRSPDAASLLALAAVKKNRNIARSGVPRAAFLEATPARGAALRRSRAPRLSRAFGSRAPKTGQHNRVSPNAAAAPTAKICTMMKLLALLATATALKQPLQKPLAVRGGGIDKAGVVKAVNIAWGFYAAQMILVPSKVHNDHFEEKSTKMTEFWARGHGVSIAVGIYALTQLDTDTAFKAAMAWVAGIGIARAKFGWFDPRSSATLLIGLGAGFVANRAE